MDTYPDHSADEDRYILLGGTVAGTLVVVVHVERGDNVREGSNIVLLDPDVAARFKTSEEVNDALREQLRRSAGDG